MLLSRENSISGYDGQGYPFVSLSSNNKQTLRHVHRLVALAFVENPKPDEYGIVNHKDENPKITTLTTWSGVHTHTI